ncbi:hypothetical protein GF378_01690 [Candidatus Pacearchaeota archaeon]|nr:hypothetical protein [Candidatus Pacearchaeota archaeon]
MSKLYDLTKSLYSFWQKQFEKANIVEEIDPTNPSNIYDSLDGIAFDFEKVWIRSQNRDHMMYLDVPNPKTRTIKLFEFAPFSNILVFPSNFKGEPIDCCSLFRDYLSQNWKDSKYFTLPRKQDVRITTQPFRDVEYYGIEIEKSVKNAYTKDGLKNEVLNDWRLNIFSKIRPFYEEYKYSEGNNDPKPKKYADYNPHWPYRPSVEKGFIKHFKRVTREQLLQEIEQEEQARIQKQEKD